MPYAQSELIGREYWNQNSIIQSNPLMREPSANLKSVSLINRFQKMLFSLISGSLYQDSNIRGKSRFVSHIRFSLIKNCLISGFDCLSERSAHGSPECAG